MNRKIAAHSRLASQAGLTLVEIVIVLVILSVLVAFLTQGLFGKGQAAKAQINLMQLNKLKNAINNFQLQYNALPNDIGALVGCNDQTGQACIPIAQKEDLVDVFGTDIIYSLDGGNRGFVLKSLGADRKPGGTGPDTDVQVTGP